MKKLIMMQKLEPITPGLKPTKLGLVDSIGINSLKPQRFLNLRYSQLTNKSESEAQSLPTECSITIAN